MQPNPDLLSTSGAQQTVSPIAAITQPMSNTRTEPVWFYCTLPTASFHRQDGKKLPFMHNFYKAETVEDIRYLRNEIVGQNPYLREATSEEMQNVQMKENPIAAIKEQVRAEVENSFTIEELQSLIEKRKAAVASGVAGKVVHAASTGMSTANLAAGLPKI